MKARKPARKRAKKTTGHTWREKVAQPSTGNLRRAKLQGDLRQLSDFFVESRNPAAAWLCWSLGQQWGLPVSEPITAEINRFAAAIAEKAISALDGNQDVVITGDLVGALWDTKTRRQGSTPIAEELRLWDRNIEIAWRVHELRKVTSSKDEAFEIAAREFGISESSADHISRRYRARLKAEEAEIDDAGH
ncbi:MAG: hypothetical protein CFE29_17895 [Bradyrhizobiaceae bacterium PARB1]|jgi:hypothetical protein|nr:MAG: hypothetical protein CFE29_17895 [Bradyrhizobiaceae bacterium PARB1]